MVEIPKHVQDFLPGKLAWVATASCTGNPNTTPKGTLKLLDSQHVCFADLFSGKTRHNLLENKQIAVTIADPSTGKGYQLKGTAELVDSGPLFEAACKQVAEIQKGLPTPHAVVKITVEAVFDQSAGTEPGKQIA
jgi:predicted pyridoxine 5'-phosphate oxidase superfamily flavin-nucleotide-binding protein